MNERKIFKQLRKHDLIYSLDKDYIREDLGELLLDITTWRIIEILVINTKCRITITNVDDSRDRNEIIVDGNCSWSYDSLPRFSEDKLVWFTDKIESLSEILEAEIHDKEAEIKNLEEKLTKDRNFDENEKLYKDVKVGDIINYFSLCGDDWMGEKKMDAWTVISVDKNKLTLESKFGIILTLSVNLDSNFYILGNGLSEFLFLVNKGKAIDDFLNVRKSNIEKEINKFNNLKTNLKNYENNLSL